MMLIKDNRKYFNVKFEEIESGDLCMASDHMLYMKIDDIVADTERLCNAVNLANGHTVLLSDEEAVTRIEGVLELK